MIWSLLRGIPVYDGNLEDQEGLRMLGARLYSEHSLFAARAWTLFNEERALTDEATAEHLQKLIDGFVAFCDEH